MLRDLAAVPGPRLSTLAAVESSRLWQRRSTRWILGTLVAFLLAGAATLAATHHQDVAAAQRAAEQTRAEVLANQVSAWEACRREYSDPDAICGADRPTGAETSAFFEDPRYLPSLEWRQNLNVVGLLQVLAGFLVGVLSVGADWAHGGFASLALLEPRRRRWFCARFGALLGWGLVGGLAVALITGVAAALVTAVSGSWEGWDSAATTSAIAMLARSALAGTLAALAGGMLAHLFRGVTGALVAGIAYLSVVENVLRGVVPSSARWLVTENVLALVRADGLDVLGGSYWLPDGSRAHEVAHLGHVEAASFLVVLCLALAAAALFTIHRRDIT